MSNAKLTSMVKTSGCAAKLAPSALHQVIDSLPVMVCDNLIEGFESADDALVYRIDDEKVMVQTVDFFPPMVDDPFVFGQIAAANALSDIYAMGGVPSVAMNLMCFPACLDLEIMRQILLGGQSKAFEAGAVIAGGHTISDAEPKYGLCVTGLMKASEVWSNKTARPGDSIVLTKALGCGIINTAAKAEDAPQSSIEAAVASMTSLNARARNIGRTLDVHAATDVTGFSLCGHASEVASASKVTILIDSSKVPVLEGALELAMQGYLPSGRYANEDYLQDKVAFQPSVKLCMRDLLFDPQTSGGLLLFMSEENAKTFVKEFGAPSAIIGHVVSQSGHDIEVL